MIELISLWRAEADSIDLQMSELSAGRYFSQLSLSERAEFRVLQCRQTCLRDCAAALEDRARAAAALYNHLTMRSPE